MRPISDSSEAICLKSQDRQAADDAISVAQAWPDWLETTNTTIGDLLALARRSEVVSFALGLPPDEFLPTQEALSEALRDAEAEFGARHLQYTPVEGLDALRSRVADYMKETVGASVSSSNILITSGAQQALDMIAKALLSPGDAIAIEEPTYPGAIEAWRPYAPSYVDLMRVVNGDAPGAANRLKFAYVQSRFRNPDGRTLEPADRLRIVEWSRRTSVPLVEDDPYGTLSFAPDGRIPKSILAEASQNGAEPLENLIYVGTFSKTIAPGLRLGWIAADSELISTFAAVSSDHTRPIVAGSFRLNVTQCRADIFPLSFVIASFCSPCEAD